MESDAHSVADYIGMSYLFWATLWFIFAIVASLVGLLCVFDGVTYKEEQKRQKEFQASSIHYDDSRQSYNAQAAQYHYAAEDGNIPVATAVQVW